MDLWKFGGPVKRAPAFSVGKVFFTPDPLGKKTSVVADANAIFDLALKKGVGRHRANRPGLLSPVEYTPQSRLSLFGFKRSNEKRTRMRERKQERSKARCFRQERVTDDATTTGLI